MKARGLGLAELGRDRDRRGALLQARAQPRRRGQLDGPSSYLMKSPHRQRPDHIARADTEKFIARYTGLPASKPRPAHAPAARASARPARRAYPEAVHSRSPTSRPNRGSRTASSASTSTRSLQSSRGAGIASLIVAPATRRGLRPRRAGRCGRRARSRAAVEHGRAARRCSRPARVVASRRRNRPGTERRRSGRRRAHRRDAAQHAAARLRPRARAVRAEHSEHRAAPLALAQRRHVPRPRRATDLDPGDAPVRRTVLRPTGMPGSRATAPPRR